MFIILGAGVPLEQMILNFNIFIENRQKIAENAHNII